MTMHLLNVRDPQSRKKTKPTKAMVAEWQAECHQRNKWLKSLGMAKQTFEQFLDEKHGKVKKQPQRFEPLKLQQQQTRETPYHPSLSTMCGPCVKTPPKVYTGTAMLGIGTLHKSNSVPIFSKDEAQDIAKMRRS